MIEVRASSFGSCIRAQVTGCLGEFDPEAPPEKMQQAFDRGHEHEMTNSGALLASGWWIDREQEEVKLILTPHGVVTGHLDGRIYEGGYDAHPRVWESKAPAAWEKFEYAYKTDDWSDPLAYRYSWQISVYMIATGLEALVTCWDEEHGNRMFGIEVPPRSLEEIEERVGEIARWVEEGRPPPLCSSKDYPCPFWKLCLHEDKKVEDEELDELVVLYDAAAALEKTAKEGKAAAQVRIREHLGDRDRLETARSLVTVYQQAGRTSLDEDAMVADGIDVEKYRKRGAPSERMKITRRNGGTP